jgi:hypothetical protein
MILIAIVSSVLPGDSPTTLKRYRALSGNRSHAEQNQAKQPKAGMTALPFAFSDIFLIR